MGVLDDDVLVELTSAFFDPDFAESGFVASGFVSPDFVESEEPSPAPVAGVERLSLR